MGATHLNEKQHPRFAVGTLFFPAILCTVSKSWSNPSHIKVELSPAFLLSGLCPVPEARAVVEARAVAEAKKRKAGLRVKRIKVGAAAGVQRRPETNVKTNLRAVSITAMRKQRAGVAARRRVGAGVRTGGRRGRARGAGAGTRAGAPARIRGKAGSGAGMRAEVEAGAAARAREARGAASETANRVARRKGRTAASGPGQPPRKRSVQNQILTKKRREGRARMELHTGCLTPGLGPFPSQNHVANQILVPGPSLFQSLDPGPSLDLGLPLGHAPDHGQGLAPDPNLAGTVGKVFCTCSVVVAQVIEVETSTLYILTNPDGVSAMSGAAPPRCARWRRAVQLTLNIALPGAPESPCLPGKALQRGSAAPRCADGRTVG